MNIESEIKVVVVVGSLRTAYSNEDYCSPVLCLGAKQRTPSHSSVAFYDMPGKDWAVCVFFVPVHTRGTSECQRLLLLYNLAGHAMTRCAVLNGKCAAVESSLGRYTFVSDIFFHLTRHHFWS